MQRQRRRHPAAMPLFAVAAGILATVGVGMLMLPGLAGVVFAIGLSMNLLIAGARPVRRPKRATPAVAS